MYCTMLVKASVLCIHYKANVEQMTNYINVLALFLQWW